MVWYHFPPQSKVDRLIPKNKFYTQGQANSKIEQLFIEQVDNIRWSYKLAASTIHLQDHEDLKEIQIFRINSRVENLDSQILSFIDKLILTPIIFEVVFEQRLQVIATYKRLNQSDKTKTVIGEYYRSEWLNLDERVAIPFFLKLVDLYEHFISLLLPITVAQTQVDSIGVSLSIEEKIEEAKKLEILKKQIDRVQNRLNKERQFNRKLEINSQLRKLKLEYDDLINAKKDT